MPKIIFRKRTPKEGEPLIRISERSYRMLELIAKQTDIGVRDIADSLINFAFRYVQIEDGRDEDKQVEEVEDVKRDFEGRDIKKRNDEIYKQRGQGMTLRAIAAIYDISPERVRQICKHKEYEMRKKA